MPRSLSILSALVLLSSIAAAGENVSAGGYTMRFDPHDVVHGGLAQTEHVHFGRGCAGAIADNKYDGRTGAAWGDSPPLSARQLKIIGERFRKVLLKIDRHFRAQGIEDTFWQRLLTEETDERQEAA